MRIFVDTSALFALLDRDDANHKKAKEVWNKVLNLPIINIEWITPGVHRSGASVLLAVSRRKLSLVDCISFEIMRNSGIKIIFTFDSHFEEQGFHCIP